MVQVSGHGCGIIVEVFVGNKCLAWKVGCLGKETKGEPFSWLLLYLAAFDTTVNALSLEDNISVFENNNKDPEKKTNPKPQYPCENLLIEVAGKNLELY